MAIAGYLPPVVAEVVSEIGKYSAGMGEVKAEMTGLQAAQTKLAAAGKVAATALAVGLAGVGFESTKLAMAFQQQMEVIHTQAGASQAEVEALKGSVLALAGVVGIGPEKLAEGLYHIESTGLRGKAAMDVLTQSAKLAAIGMADLDDVTYAMSGVMSIGMKDVKDASDAISYMNATVGMGDMRMSQLAAAIGTGILPSFKSAGLGMKDFSAALATIADNSTPADEAATRLRMTIAMMAAPSGPARDALRSIGLSATALATDLRQPNGLLIAVEDLKTHLERSGKSAVEQNAIIEHAFGGGKTSGSILTLLEEVDRLKSKYDQLGTTESRAAVTDAAWAAQQKQFSQQWHEFVATLQAVGVRIGTWLIPKLEAVVSWVNRNTEAAKIAAAVIGGILVLAIGAWTVALVEAAIANIAATWEILLIIAAVAALAFGIYELVKHWNTVWSWIKRIAGDVWGWLVGAWHATVDALTVAAGWVKSRVIDPVARWFHDNLLAPIRQVLSVLRAWWDFAWGFYTVVIQRFRRNWDITWGAIAAIVRWAWETRIRPVLDFATTYLVGPMMAAIHWVERAWHLTWTAIAIIAKWAWDTVLYPVFRLVVERGIGTIKTDIAFLRKVWDQEWSAIGKIISWVWDHTLGPVFDKIVHIIDTVKSKIGEVFSNPGKAGADFAHMLGFADGGIVPGPTGAPRLAVVHGGEQILSNDQLATMGRQRVFAGGGRGVASAGGGGGDVVFHARFVMPDGKHVRTETLRYARRAGISPADLYPANTGDLVRG